MGTTIVSKCLSFTEDIFRGTMSSPIVMFSILLCPLEIKRDQVDPKVDNLLECFRIQRLLQTSWHDQR